MFISNIFIHYSKKGAYPDSTFIYPGIAGYIIVIAGSLIYHEIILLEIKKVLLIVKKAKDGDDGVEFLINNKIPSMIANMEMLIEAGLGDGDDNPQKVLTLRR